MKLNMIDLDPIIHIIITQSVIYIVTKIFITKLQDKK